jgi:deferrochelatase/peroxidase EfeB
MIAVDKPLDLNASDAGAFLHGIQGNILRAHGRDHSVSLLIRFGADVSACRAWVAQFASRIVWAEVQAQQTATYKSTGDGGSFVNFALSASGYRALGIAPLPGDAVFAAGLKNSAALRATDPPPATWEAAFQGDLHAHVLIADQDAARLQRIEAEVVGSLAGIGALADREQGDAIVRDNGRGETLDLVHFGFADGLSQPLTIQQDIDKEVALRGKKFWDPGAPLNLLLAPDPAGGWGSYLVFRKLEQNVAGFLQAEAALADALGLTGENRKRAEAMIVGRYRDGTPALPAAPEPNGDPGNDFNFSNDRFGATCPYQAHIRKTNPRGDLASAGTNRLPIALEVERALRIGRRGIPYGSADYMSNGGPAPSQGVGLLFMSVQARMRNFELLQGGSDVDDFPNAGIGVDATIGHANTPSQQTWIVPPNIGGGPASGFVRYAIANFVTLKGGEYFFHPSRAFFEKLPTL